MEGNDRIGLRKLFRAFFTKALPSITDGPTDGPTDRPTDTPSYRDARTHLKTDSDYAKTGRLSTTVNLQSNVFEGFDLNMPLEPKNVIAISQIVIVIIVIVIVVIVVIVIVVIVIAVIIIVIFALVIVLSSFHHRHRHRHRHRARLREINSPEIARRKPGESPKARTKPRQRL